MGVGQRVIDHTDTARFEELLYRLVTDESHVLVPLSREHRLCSFQTIISDVNPARHDRVLLLPIPNISCEAN